jgi:hypothetical protein
MVQYKRLVVVDRYSTPTNVDPVKDTLQPTPNTFYLEDNAQWRVFQIACLCTVSSNRYTIPSHGRGSGGARAAATRGDGESATGTPPGCMHKHEWPFRDSRV